MVHAPARSEDIRAEVAELLGVDADAVQPGSNLIGQGLDSIRIMTLAGRWRRQGIAVDFATLAETPTVEAWAELVNAGKPSADRPAEPADAPADAGRSGEDEPFSLAPMQHAMWVGRQENQQLGGVAGHLYVEFDGGGIDPERLRAAATALARRHPMLRVRFLPDGTQRIAPADEFGPFPVHVEDLRERSTGEADRRLAAIRAAKSHQQLDGAVFELAVTLLPAERSRLHVDLDMQAADAMSYRTLMADLAALYLGRDLPELGYTYRQYRHAIEAEDARPQPARDADRAWWARRLPELPDPPALPTTGGRAENQSTRRWHWLDPHTRDALFARAQARGFTPAMALAAGFANTLARWSTTSRFLLNVPLFGRQALHPDVDSLVGDFTSSLLLDVDLTRANTAAARAQVVQDAMRTAAAHSAYPGLAVLRDLSRHRGTQVLAPVVFTSALGLGELFSSDVTGQFGTPGWIISQGPQVLLDAQVTEFDGGVLVNWDVREGVFPAGVIDAMFAHHIDELLRLASADEAWEAPGPPALPEAQRAVREAANGRTAEPSGEALHDGFFRQAEQRPDAPAVFASSGDLSYAQLRDQALAVAAALRAAGVTAGDTIAVMGPKTAEQIPALLGILSVGAVYLPIGVDQPRDRAERILESGGVSLAVVCGGQRLSMPVPEVVLADILGGAPASTEITSARVDPAALAYVLFTSGSTGEPKGVEVTHDAAMNTVEFIGRHFDIGPADRCLALSTLEGDISVMDVFVTLRTGGSIVVVDEAQRRDPDAWARLIDAHQVPCCISCPAGSRCWSRSAAGGCPRCGWCPPEATGCAPRWCAGCGSKPRRALRGTRGCDRNPGAQQHFRGDRADTRRLDGAALRRPAAQQRLPRRRRHRRRLSRLGARRVLGVRPRYRARLPRTPRSHRRTLRRTRRPNLVSHRRSGPLLARRHPRIRRPRRPPRQDQRVPRRARRGRDRVAARAGGAHGGGRVDRRVRRIRCAGRAGVR